MATSTTKTKLQQAMPQPSKGYTLSDLLVKVQAQVKVVEADQAAGKWDGDLMLPDAFTRLEQQDKLIAVVLEMLTFCEQTSEQKDVTPASDVMGRAKLTASAVKAGFKRSMKEYTESTVRQTVADTIYADLTKMREEMKRILTRANEIQGKIKDAKAALEAQRQLYEKSAAPKLEAKKARKQKQLARLQEELAQLNQKAASA